MGLHFLVNLGYYFMYISATVLLYRSSWSVVLNRSGVVLVADINSIEFTYHCLEEWLTNIQSKLGKDPFLGLMNSIFKLVKIITDISRITWMSKIHMEWQKYLEH